MKIPMLHDYGTAAGGAELQMLSLRQGLSDCGHQVRLFASSAMPVAGYDQPADDICFRVFQLNTYPVSHRDRPNGPSSRPWHGCFFSWDTLSTTSRLQVLTQVVNPSAYWQVRQEFQPDQGQASAIFWLSLKINPFVIGAMVLAGPLLAWFY